MRHVGGLGGVPWAVLGCALVHLAAGVWLYGSGSWLLALTLARLAAGCWLWLIWLLALALALALARGTWLFGCLCVSPSKMRGVQFDSTYVCQTWAAGGVPWRSLVLIPKRGEEVGEASHGGPCGVVVELESPPRVEVAVVVASSKCTGDYNRLGIGIGERTNERKLVVF